MVDLPKKKVGIIACSGEEMPEGTVTRLAALRVLEALRPDDTVTICLPLFLAGGEGDRAFARFYPTVAVDGCELRCAARATEMYSGKPAASIVVSDWISREGMEKPQGARRLNAAGVKAVEFVAERIAETVDELLEKKWNRSTVSASSPVIPAEDMLVLQQPVVTSCACGSGIPVQTVWVEGQPVTVLALPLIFEQMLQAGKPVQKETADELLETVKLYNPIPAEAEEVYRQALLRDYAAYCGGKLVVQ